MVHGASTKRRLERDTHLQNCRGRHFYDPGPGYVAYSRISRGVGSRKG